MNEIVEYVKKMIDDERLIVGSIESSYNISDRKFSFSVHRNITLPITYDAHLNVADGSGVRYNFTGDEAKELWFYIENHNSEIKEEDNKKAARFILEMIK